MKRSRMRRGAIVAFALAMLLSGCSKFTVQSGVDIKSVPIDLAFGQPPSAAPAPQAPLLPPVPLELPPQLPNPEPTFSAAPVCAPVSAVGARDEAITAVPADSAFTQKMKARQGAYLYDYVWNYAGKEQHSLVGAKELKDFKLTNDNYNNSTPGGFSFNMYDDVDPKIILGLASWEADTHAATYGQGQADEQDHDGLFFNQIVIPRDTKGPEADDFRGPPQLYKLMDYPINEGQTFTFSGPDSGFKPGAQVPNPVTGGFLSKPAEGTLTITSQVGAKQIVAVCDQLAQAWEVSIDINASEQGAYNFHLVGKLWLDTAYGGTPVREDYTITGDLIQGNFFSQMMRLDPGEYA